MEFFAVYEMLIKSIFIFLREESEKEKASSGKEWDRSV